MKFLATARHAAGSLSRATLMAGAVVGALAAPPAQALDVYVRVGQFNQTMPDGTTVPMWGYRVANARGGAMGGNLSSPGPAITVPDNDPTLNVHLINQLPVPTSFVLHGQTAAMAPVFKTIATVNDPTGTSDCVPGSDLTCRVRSFTKETAAGGEVVYSFTDVKPGTYLYQSGTLPQIQVQMGLYGMMRKNATPPLTPGANAYDNVTFDKQVPLILSEVDPVVHAQVATGSFTGSTLNYNPKFFRIHRYGDGNLAVPVDETATGANNWTTVDPGKRLLLRLLNAGLQSRSLVLSTEHWYVMAEDGNPYPYPREQSSVFLPAAKTADVWMTPTVGDPPRLDRTITIFDHALGLSNNNADAVGGMLFQLLVNDTTTLPTLDVSACPTTGVQNTPYTCTVASNTGTPSYALDIAPVGMSIDAATGVITWTPTNDQAQRPAAPTLTNALRVRATDTTTGGFSASPTVQIAVANVNDAPLAINDTYTVRGGALAVSNPLLGVRANDSDPDGDALGAVTLASGPAAVGDGVTLNADGTFTFTATDYTKDRVATFTYQVSDGALLSNVATVTLNVMANVAPVAVEDSVAIVFNVTPQRLFIDVMANDYDLDNNLNFADPTRLQVVGAPNHGGEAVRVNTANCPTAGRPCIRYTPPLGFRGTEAFTYRIRDNLNVWSVPAVVRVNIQ